MANINWRVTDLINTEANWITENPILLAGEHAVSSDQLHPGTNQPKYKIGNGVDRWVDLDYYPVGGAGATPDLETVLTEGNTTTLPIVGTTGNALNLNAGSGASLSGGSGAVTLSNDNGSATLRADGALEIDTNKITGLTNGTNPSDAVNFGQFSSHTSNTSNPHATTLEQARTQGNQIAGTIISPNGVTLNLDDTTPGTNSFSVTATNGVDTAQTYLNAGQFFAGDIAQNTGIYANLGATDAGIYNPNGSLTLNADGTISAGSNKVVDVANGAAATDAVNKGQLDAITPTPLFLTGSDQTNNTTTPQAINGLSHSLAANSRYAVRASIRIGCSGSAGVFPSITVPTGATLAINVYGFTTASTVDANQLISASATPTGVAFCRLISTACVIDIYGTITTSSTAGNFQVLFHSASAGQTSTVFVEGTYGEIKKFV